MKARSSILSSLFKPLEGKAIARAVSLPNRGLSKNPADNKFALARYKHKSLVPKVVRTPEEEHRDRFIKLWETCVWSTREPEVGKISHEDFRQILWTSFPTTLKTKEQYIQENHLDFKTKQSDTDELKKYLLNYFTENSYTYDLYCKYSAWRTNNSLLMIAYEVAFQYKSSHLLDDFYQNCIEHHFGFWINYEFTQYAFIPAYQKYCVEQLNLTKENNFEGIKVTQHFVAHHEALGIARSIYWESYHSRVNHLSCYNRLTADFKSAALLSPLLFEKFIQHWKEDASKICMLLEIDLPKLTVEDEKSKPAESPHATSCFSRLFTRVAEAMKKNGKSS